MLFYGGDLPALVSVSLAMRSMTISAKSSKPIHFLPMEVISGAPQNVGDIQFLPMTLTAVSTGGPTLSFATGTLSLQPLRMEGFLGLHTGASDMFFPPMGVLSANYSYAAALMSFQAMQQDGFCFADSSTDGLIYGVLRSGSAPAGLSFISVAFSSDMTVAAALLGASVGTDVSVESLLLDDSFVTSVIASAEFLNFINIGAVGPPFSNPGTVWVVNAESGASSTYADFPFNSYAKIGDGYFGLKEDGLYRLDADQDDGGPVIGTLDFGRLNFGSTAKSRVTDVYVGVSTVGKMYLRITADGKTYTYSSTRANAELTSQRFVPGKGITANWLGFQLLNADEADFELSTIEFQVVKMTRRI
jgi:hypothetical protein